MAVQGNYAYIGEGPWLTVLDISNPATPAVVGKTAPFPDIVQGVAVAGGYAYVAGGNAGLRVVDVTDPAQPREVGAYATLGWANDVFVVGNYVYVADTEGGLVILRFTGGVECYDFISPAGVGVEDIQAVAGRWRTRGCEANYVPAYDFNDDQVINVADIMRVAAAWGPCP